MWVEDFGNCVIPVSDNLTSRQERGKRVWETLARGLPVEASGLQLVPVRFACCPNKVPLCGLAAAELIGPLRKSGSSGIDEPSKLRPPKSQHQLL